MRDLAKSIVRFSMATSLLGVSQVANLVRSSRVPSTAAKYGGGQLDRLDVVTWAAQGQLGEVLQAAFQVGDHLQGEWVGLLTDAFVPWRWSRTVSELADRSVTAMRVASPGQVGALARQELRNKFEVYWLVKGARSKLDLASNGEELPLAELVERAYQLGEYQALWVVEGLGHETAEVALRASVVPRGLFSGERLEGLPTSSLPMLHGGLGLACAEHVLRRLTPHSSVVEVLEGLGRFLELCRDNSMDRYVDSAIEALGLDARCFFPDLVPVLEHGLVMLGDPVLHQYFWHGVGRALYFLPINFVPGYGSLWRAVQMSQNESPHKMARQNTLAGVSYAFTMVNMSHPKILEKVLFDHGADIGGTTFVDGVVAAVVMRNQITPHAPVLRAFVNHQPEPKTAEIWQQVVQLPGREALGLDGSDPAAVEMPGIYRSMPRTRGVD